MDNENIEHYVDNILTGLELDVPDGLRDKIISRIRRVDEFVKLANRGNYLGKSYYGLRSTQVISTIVMLTLADYYK